MTVQMASLTIISVKETRSRKCGTTTACPDGKYTYYVKSGAGRDGVPTVCFNGYKCVLEFHMIFLLGDLCPCKQMIIANCRNIYAVFLLYDDWKVTFDCEIIHDV